MRRKRWNRSRSKREEVREEVEEKEEENEKQSAQCEMRKYSVISPASLWYSKCQVDAVESSPPIYLNPPCLHYRRKTPPTLPWSGTLGCFFYQSRQDISHTRETG